MKKSYIFGVMSLVLAGCTTHRSVSELTDAQRDTAQMLVQQSEQLELQRQQLLALQNERNDIVQEIAELRRELADRRPPETGPSAIPPAKSAMKTKRAPAKRPVTNLPQFDESGKVILGKEEWVWFDLLGRSVKTKVDTGVKSSLIYSSDVQLFERDGEQWVRFALAIDEKGELSADEPAIYEAPLVRRVRTRAANGGEAETRPIVKLKMKLGEIVDDTEFILTKRDTNEFSVVLGRSFLRDIAVVDVARKYTQNKNSESSSL